MRLTVLRYEILHVMSYLLASSAIARSSTTAASDRKGAVGWTWANFTPPIVNTRCHAGYCCAQRSGKRITCRARCLK